MKGEDERKKICFIFVAQNKSQLLTCNLSVLQFITLYYTSSNHHWTFYKTLRSFSHLTLSTDSCIVQFLMQDCKKIVEKSHFSWHGPVPHLHSSPVACCPTSQDYEIFILIARFIHNPNPQEWPPKGNGEGSFFAGLEDIIMAQTEKIMLLIPSITCTLLIHAVVSISIRAKQGRNGEFNTQNFHSVHYL